MKRKYTFYVTLMLILCGLICYFIMKTYFPSLHEIIMDDSFREMVIVFSISGLVTIFGVDYILDKKAVVDTLENLKIAGLGYEIHTLYAKSINHLTKFGFIEYPQINEMQHNHYATNRNQKTIEEARAAFKAEMTAIGATYVPIDYTEKTLKEFESLLFEYEQKFLIAPKVNSDKLNDFTKIHEVIKNVIHVLKRHLGEPESGAKNFRVHLGMYRLAYLIVPFMNDTPEVFIMSEREYDDIFTNHNKKISSMEYRQQKEHQA